MTKTIDIAEMRAAMRGAARYMDHKSQVAYLENYAAEDHRGDAYYTPVGAVLLWLGADPFEIARQSDLHRMDCPDYDYEPDCPICRDGCDISIYNEWVQNLLLDAGLTFTERATDLIWEVENAGMPLYQWLEQFPHHPAMEPPEFALGATLTFDEYQERAEKTAIYPPHLAFEYLVPGLAAEAGEVADKYAKSIRDGHLDKEGLLKELGDVLWMVGRLAAELSTPLGGIAEGNLKKLEDRQERGVLGGSGDNR